MADPLGEDEVENLSAEEMQKQIAELESAIASAEQEQTETVVKSTSEDPDVERLRLELANLEEEIAKFSDSPALTGSTGCVEGTSIYIGNVDYSSSADELQNHFLPCGDINRCTIMCQKATGQPLGYAYIEFTQEDSAVKALDLNDSLFKGRQLKVLPKRVNVPGLSLARGGRRAGSPRRVSRRIRGVRRPRSSYDAYQSYSPRAFRPRRRFSRFHHPYSSYY
eukprot:NODE_1569_length_844_cov_292.211321_g1219_i0.p1 GENE.NODE_1569_length_844_cov_292.211321_g1219_i0~~NODE_1569_length_844_cov_292.211321_g1219_i0.p1  ORF type:complete len:223 (-),score=16.03 NODE_1569_length_844_cov_292.211321_g1219_i0:81-749(-)